MSLMASFCVVHFPRHVLDDIWDLIESVSESFLTYSSKTPDLLMLREVCLLLRHSGLCFPFVFIRFVFLFRSCFSGEPKQKQGRGLVDHKLVQAPPPPPVIFIAGRPKAALLLWFFGDFRCGALLFVVINVIYKYKNR